MDFSPWILKNSTVKIRPGTGFSPWKLRFYSCEEDGHFSWNQGWLWTLQGCLWKTVHTIPLLLTVHTIPLLLTVHTIPLLLSELGPGINWPENRTDHRTKNNYWINLNLGPKFGALGWPENQKRPCFQWREKRNHVYCHNQPCKLLSGLVMTVLIFIITALGTWLWLHAVWFIRNTVKFRLVFLH